MKNIVFLGSGLSNGGAEHQGAQLMNMLVEKGYNITYASFGDVPDHYYISTSVKRIQLAANKSITRKLFAIFFFLLRVKTDVVVAFSQRLSVLVLFPLLFRPRIKVISGERNFTIGDPDRYEKILIKTGIYKRANYIVPNNFSQGRYLAGIMPSIRDKIYVITNYTDIDLFTSSPVPNNDVLRIGLFCRFEAQKNFHRFLDVLYLLKKKYGLSFRVDWYGNHTFKSDGQVYYYQEGIKKFKDYHLNDILFIHDPIKDVQKLIPSFDVLCLPSLHEGFSNSISEYICCGRPVICSNVSDNPILVHEGENGFLFNPLDIDDMVMAFDKYFATSKETRRRMGEKSREIAESLFDKTRFINDYIQLIEA